MMAVGVGVDSRHYSIFNSHCAYSVVITLDDETAMFNGFDGSPEYFIKLHRATISRLTITTENVQLEK